MVCGRDSVDSVMTCRSRLHYSYIWGIPIVLHTDVPCMLLCECGAWIGDGVLAEGVVEYSYKVMYCVRERGLFSLLESISILGGGSILEGMSTLGGSSVWSWGKFNFAFNNVRDRTYFMHNFFMNIF